MAAGEEDRGQAIVAWIQHHRKWVIWAGVIVLLGGGLFGWKVVSTRQGERVASQELNAARFALDAKNYALAASELSRISANYAGTRSANEASILLALVRLSQGQGQQAIQLLKDYAPSAPAEYRPQAYGLLGAAYESVGHPKEAADAYLEAAAAARLPFLRGQYLSDAGRSWLAAGDTARATAAYQEIVTKLDSTSAAFEAKERLGELGISVK